VLQAGDISLAYDNNLNFRLRKENVSVQYRLRKELGRENKELRVEKEVVGMNVKMRSFVTALVGVVLISMLTLNSTVYGEEPLKEYYANGKLKSEQSFKDGKLEGIFKVYYESGQLRKVGFYKNGKREGPFKTYYDNGQVVIDEFFLNGKQEGPFKTYYKNGQLRSDSFYKDGKQAGKLQEYDESGKLKK
jgi:antitoxin component YwqK of YwqJK toxin-antitoxin module